MAPKWLRAEYLLFFWMSGGWIHNFQPAKCMSLVCQWHGRAEPMTDSLAHSRQQKLHSHWPLSSLIKRLERDEPLKLCAQGLIPRRYSQGSVFLVSRGFSFVPRDRYEHLQRHHYFTVGALKILSTTEIMICVGHRNVKSRIKGYSWGREDGSVGKAFAVHSGGPEFTSPALC